MPALPSFIKQKPAKWKSLVSNRTPFPTRFDNISSPHPYAAPDILDIHESTGSFGSVTAPPPPAKPSVQDSPQITLDLNVNLSTGDFDSDWIENQFAPTPVSHHQLDRQGGERNRMAVYESRPFAPTSTLRWEPKGVPTEVPIDDDDDDIDLSTSEDDVVKSLEAMDASTFLRFPPQESQMTEQTMPSPARRNPPAPIRIPSLSMHGPQVQIVRSAGQNSRPLSEVSTAESSAVSGQTLARALLGNSFVLSSDNRSSRYKSGFGGLVRSDSATLPRGDHPLMNSPFLRDRTLSGTSETFLADHDVPPIPPNAGKVYVPPQAPRHSGVESKKSLRRPSSTGSLSSPISGGGLSESRSRPNSIGEVTREIEKIEKDLRVIRRISRISEAPSVVSTTTPNPDTSPLSPSSEQSPATISPGTAELFPTPPSTDPPSISPAPSSSSKSPVTSSTPASSTRFSDNIVDYYSSPDTPELGRPFAPVVSPIIEETSSQLSTPASRRLSQRPTSRTISPLSGTINGRIDFNVVRRPSDGSVISTNNRRISAQMTPAGSSSLQPPSHTSQIAPHADDKGTATNPRVSLVPPPPINRVVGGRLRSGSAPSPINTTRDSRDLSAYKIISPLPENAAETPSTGGSNGMEVQQTFPETPNVFSPFWSPGTSSPGMTHGMPEGYDVSPMPQTPKSAMIPVHGRDPHRGLGAQVLTRSASMWQATHPNQHVVLRRELSEPQPPASTSVPSDPVKLDESDTGDDAEAVVNQVVEVPLSVPSEVSPTSSASQYSDVSGGPQSTRQEITRDFTSMETVIEAGPVSPPSSVDSSPRLGYLTQTSPEATPIPPDDSYASYRPTEFTNPFDPYANPSSPRFDHFDHRTFGVPPLNPSLPTPPPVVVTPPAGDNTSVPSPYPNRSLRRISEISHNLESPPAYEDIHHDQPPSITPTSGNSNVEPQFSSASAQPSPPVTHDSSNEYLPLNRRPSTGNRDRRGRMRPTGPRRPLSHLPHTLPTGRNRNPSISSVNSTAQNTHTPPPKSASATPVNEPKPFPNNPLNSDGQPGYSPSTNTTLAVNNTPIALSPKSPNFQVPPNPYRGLTMDQAKWTFTSAQLQTIVSRAIRQTAEASSIRLLRLEVLDNDIPQQLNELDARKSEIKSRYRLLTRTSGSLFLKLDNQITSGSAESQRTLEELRDITRQLNNLTEELHSVDQQQAQIQSLVQTHSSSALRMALRKLNTSFLKQLSQTQALERQVAELEDEIWTLNELRTMKASPEPQNPSRTQSFRFEPQPRSPPAVQDSPSQVTFPNSSESWGSESGSRKSTLSHARTITRKPSLSYSMSIRSAGNRLSQRSSMSSAGARTSVMSGGGMGGLNSAVGVPPVPPLPRKRPTDIITGASTRSTTMISTDGTPGTEVRAMMRAQDELYRMLGMSLRDDTRLRRSHSVIGLPGNPEAQLHPSINANNSRQPSAVLSRSESLDSGPFSNRSSNLHPRPQSYPASLLEAYNPLDADRNAMLATLEMISQDSH